METPGNPLGLSTVLSHHVNLRKSSAIDLILTHSTTISQQGVIPIELSDHEMVYASSKKLLVKPRKIEIMDRSYVNFHKDQFKADLLSKNWDSVREERDVNKYWNFIEQNIRSCIDNLCPLKKIRVRDNYRTHELHTRS